MDIFSTVKSAIDLTKEILQLISDIKSADGEKKRLLSEVQACAHVLQRLDAKNDDATRSCKLHRTVQESQVPHQVLQQFESDLRALGHILRNCSAPKWPFKKAEVGSYCTKLEWDKINILLYLAISDSNSSSPDTTEISVRLHELIAVANTYSNQLSYLTAGVSRLQHESDTKELESTRKQILRWLDAADQSETHLSITRARVDGTGSSLLGSVVYESWRNSRGKSLFLHGDAGAGKTYLASLAIDDLSGRSESRPESSTAVAYFYCDSDSSEDSDPDICIRSLLSQLVAKCQRLPTSLRGIKVDLEPPPPRKDIPSLFEDVIQTFAHVYLVIDAIDEFHPSEGVRQELLGILLAVQSKTETSILVSSRPLPDVVRRFQDCPKVPVSASTKDLAMFVRNQRKRLPEFVQRRQDLVNDTVKVIVSKSQEIFMLANLHMAELHIALHDMRHTEKDYRLKLESLPTTPEQAYDRALDRIVLGGVHAGIAIPTLQFLSCAKQGLTLLEIRHALSVDPKTKRLDGEDIYQIEEEDIVSACTALVKVLGHSQIVRFSHATVQHYFNNTLRRPFPQSNSVAATACISYLLLENFRDEPINDLFEGLSSTGPRRNFAFYQYAAHHWATHSRLSGPPLDELVTSFLESRPGCLAYALLAEAGRGEKENFDWLFERTGSIPSVFNYRNMSLLHITAREGWTDATRYLLQSGMCTSGLDTMNMTPIHYAVLKGSKDIVDLFLGVGKVSMNLPIRRAIWKPSGIAGCQVWTSLPDTALPTEAGKSQGLTPLHLAILIGDVTMLNHLLKQGADVECLSAYGESVLHVAVKQSVYGPKTSIGNFDAWDEPQYRIEYSLDMVSLNAEDDNECAAVVDDLEKQRLGILETLLNLERTDIHTQDVFGRTPLHCIQYLKSHGSNHSQASVKVLQRLIKEGAKSLRDHEGLIPLHVACKAGDAAAVRILLALQTNSNITDFGGLNELHHAAQSQEAGTICAVLDKANTLGRLRDLAITRDIRDRNAFHHLFSGWASLDTVRLLIDAGVEPGHLDSHGKPPLEMHLERHCMDGAHTAEVMRILFDAGADPLFVSPDDGLGYHHIYALHALVLDIEPLGVLQARGVDLTTLDNRGRSLAHHFALNGYCTVKILDFLTGLGLSIDAADFSGMTPAQYADEARSQVRPPGEWMSDRWEQQWRILAKLP